MNGFIESSARVFPGGSVFQVNGWTASTSAEHLPRNIRQNALGSGLTAVDAEKEFHVALVAIEARRYASQCNPGVLPQQDNLAKKTEFSFDTRFTPTGWRTRREAAIGEQQATTSAWRPRSALLI
jgi:hypothetical protein